MHLKCFRNAGFPVVHLETVDTDNEEDHDDDIPCRVYGYGTLYDNVSTMMKFC